MVKKAEDYDEILQKWEKASEEEKEPLEREKQESFSGRKRSSSTGNETNRTALGYFRPVDWVQPGGSGVFCGISGKAEETSSGKKAYSGSVKLGTMS